MRRFFWVAVAGLSLAMVSAATAGTGGNKTGQACYKGQYLNYIDPSTGQPFANQDACVAFVAHGGTLTSSVDAGLTFTTPSSTGISADCFQGFPPCLTGDVSVHNPGGVPLTLTVHIAYHLDSTGGSGGSGEIGFRWSAFTCTTDAHQPDGTGDCTGTVAAGATVVVLPVMASGDFSVSGSASITASSVPDPNPSNNSVSFSLGGT